MTKDEKACWASGGIWIDGKCVKVKPMMMRMPRGISCDVVEATIRKHLKPADRRARVRALEKLNKRDR